MLPPLTAAFIVGLLLGSEFPYFPLSISCLLAVFLISVSVMERVAWVTARQATSLCALLLGGVVYWSLAVESSFKAEQHEIFPGSAIEFTGRIVQPVQQGPDRLILVVRLDEPLADHGIPRIVRLTWRVPERMLFQGDHIRFTAKWRRPSGSLNPGGFDYAAYMERQGIDAVASVTGADGVQLLESGYASWWWRPWNQFDRWRSWIRTAAVHSISQPALGLYLGIIIGDRGYLDPELRDQFMVTGTVHLLSISGSHLGLVGLLTFIFVRQTLLFLPATWLLALSRRTTPTKLAAACTMLPMTGYACLAGAELATMRSWLMAVVAMGAVWLGHERRLFHALALAAAIILLHDPQALFDISFQLSFLSVLAIAVWLSWMTAEAQEVPSVEPPVAGMWWGWARDSVAMSGIITIVTLPPVAWYFNQIPWLGLFTNLIAVPVTGLFLVPLGLAAGLWRLVFGGESLSLAGLIQWLLETFHASLRLLSTLPGAEWHVSAPSIPTMLLFYFCLGLLCVHWSKLTVRIPATTVLVILLSWWVWSPRTMIDGDRFRVTFLDVGQGDSAVVELPDGQVVLIDGGATYERFDMGRGVVAPFLWNRGIKTLDHVIGTHLQLDHVGGLAWVIRHLSVKQYWGSGERREEAFAQRLHRALHQRGLTEQVVREGQEINAGGGCGLRVLNPPDRAESDRSLDEPHKSGSVLNNRSVVVRLQCGPHTMLFTADVEREGLARLARAGPHRSIDVLKVPHHGALSSQHPEWLASVDPIYAVISVGRHNPYGHPAPAVLESYATEGAQVFRTDRDGAVWVTGRLSGRTIQMHRMKDGMLQPTRPFVCLWTCEQVNWRRVWQQWRDRT